MPSTLEWFGTTTFRVRAGDRTLFFDAYVDRLPGLDPVGLTTADVDEADFVFVSHAHFDHLYGAAAIAGRTGATVVASPESIRCLRVSGVPDDQLLTVTGGEMVDCGQNARVRVLPSLHSCLFAHAESDSSIPCLGDLDVSAQARATAVRGLFDALEGVTSPAGQAMRDMNAQCSMHDGGQLAYLLLTSDGSLLVSGSSGYWQGIFSGLRPDVALLALAGRPNVDGEPFQGSSTQYMLEQVQLVRPGSVAFCHHDPLFPGLPGVEIAAAAAALRVPGAPTGYFELEYNTPRPLFG
jgi:L-ascorbate metabolism protein UlaG (beta-lactamase superfamily)